MAVTIIVRSGGAASQSSLSVTLDAPMIVIGRGDGCDVRLPDPSVSHRHATLRARGSDHIVVDEGSTNGTYIGGVRLGVQASRIVRHGELLRVGRVWLEIRFDTPVPTANAPLATKELALALVARALDAQGEQAEPRVRITDGPDAGKSLLLLESARTYVIGRGKDVDLVLDDPDASRRHVQLVRRGEQLLARDLGSKNGASLSGAPLDVDRDRPWPRGEALQIGPNRFVYEHGAADALRELERAADERIRLDEVVDPPVMGPVSTEPEGASAARARSAAPPPSGHAAPITEIPRASQSPAAAPSRSSWSGTDVLVVLLAISVLGLSVLGLFWLLQG